MKKWKNYLNVYYNNGLSEKKSALEYFSSTYIIILH